MELYNFFFFFLRLQSGTNEGDILARMLDHKL